MKERRNDRREDSRLGSWSSAPRYMQLEWSCTGHAKSHGGGCGQSTWARRLADSPCMQDPSHIRRPPPPGSALSFMTPDTSQELTVHSPVLKRRW